MKLSCPAQHRFILVLPLCLGALVACSDSEQALTSPVTAHRADEIARSVIERFGERHHGEATYYKANGEGNCSFDATEKRMVAAINNADYGMADLCGAHLEVTGPQGTVTVRITDRCPGCKAGGLDMSEEAFVQIAEKSAGRTPVTWQIVAAPLSEPVEYRYMDGSTRYWTAIQVRNHRWPVAQLEILPSGAQEWLKVERRRYNYFVYAKPIAAGPLKVRLTAVSGAVLEDLLPEPQSGLQISGAAQF